jgi:hypothetical protein
MKSLANLLEKRKKISKISFTEKDIFYVFSAIIKEEFGNIGAAKLQPDFYKNGTVFVRAASGIWGSELFINRVRIIEKMNNKLGEKIIREIKTKQN